MATKRVIIKLRSWAKSFLSICHLPLNTEQWTSVSPPPRKWTHAKLAIFIWHAKLLRLFILRPALRKRQAIINHSIKTSARLQSAFEHIAHQSGPGCILFVAWEFFAALVPRLQLGVLWKIVAAEVELCDGSQNWDIRNRHNFATEPFIIRQKSFQHLNTLVDFLLSLVRNSRGVLQKYAALEQTKRFSDFCHEIEALTLFISTYNCHCVIFEQGYRIEKETRINSRSGLWVDWVKWTAWPFGVDKIGHDSSRLGHDEVPVNQYWDLVRGVQF